MKVFIATPMYGGQCFGFYAQSLLQLNNMMRDKEITTMMSFMFNESLIQRARNALVKNAFKTDFTHFMFIDSDIRFHGNDVISLIQADKPVIAGIYPKKEINWKTVADAAKKGVEGLQNYTGSFVVNLAGYATEVTVPINDPLEVMNAGTGFMMIQRKVFDEITEKTTVPVYTSDVVDLTGNVNPGDQITAFFDCSIEKETNRLLSEDYHFCQLYRKVGGSIWVAPWVRLAHIGSYIFEGTFIPAE